MSSLTVNVGGMPLSLPDNGSMPLHTRCDPDTELLNKVTQAVTKPQTERFMKHEIERTVEMLDHWGLDALFSIASHGVFEYDAHITPIVCGILANNKSMRMYDSLRSLFIVREFMKKATLPEQWSLCMIHAVEGGLGDTVHRLLSQPLPDPSVMFMYKLVQAFCTFPLMAHVLTSYDVPTLIRHRLKTECQPELVVEADRVLSVLT